MIFTHLFSIKVQNFLTTLNLSLIIERRSKTPTLNLNLMFELIPSKNGNNFEKNILYHYLLCQTLAFKLSTVPQLQNRPALLDKTFITNPIMS